MFDPGSFRDPSGRIHLADGKILRAVFEPGREAFKAARESGVFDRAIGKGMLLNLSEADPALAAGIEPAPAFLVEHPRIEYVSYPYEWCFSALKRAALLHLDLHLDLIGQGFTLSDATAYNVQFQGTNPVFIDHLSIVPRREGEAWTGQYQFSQQFLSPLLLWAKRGVAPNAWYRGSLEGIAPEDLNPLLGWRDKLSFTVLAHVVSQARLQKRAVSKGALESRKSNARLSDTGLKAILGGLRDYISGLSLKNTSSVWSDYANCNSYDDASHAAKREFVAEMTRSVQPNLLFDIGCNSGDYSQTALDNGAKSVVGFDFDSGALEIAFNRFEQSGASMLPLWLDAANPSPSQGWAESERKGFETRAKGDALIALAFVHHIAIARNVPLDMVVEWLMSLAPVGVIEFPSKSDPMVQKLLENREDIFANYTEDAFLSHVSSRGRISRRARLEGNDRLLIEYDSRS